jgi:5-(carboxyamino)imidazole ribonucleotide synthase
MRIGIIGGGQLGRMLALAGYPLGFTFTTLEPTEPCPLGQIAQQITSPYDDTEALGWLISRADVLTYEFENVPLETAALAAKHIALYPPPMALQVAQDRLKEKRFFRGLGAATPDFEPVDSSETLAQAFAKLGGPAILKTRRMGYDGKGQWRIDDAQMLAALDIPDSVFAEGMILEAHVDFDRELSILAVRSVSGEVAFYPLCENEHRDGILRVTRAPALDAPQANAEALAHKALDALGYVGVLAIELFEKDGKLLVNEMAPRVHNSGHWTIDGALTSQFENHLRAISGLPLGPTAARGHTGMVNVIGEDAPRERIAAISGAHLHLYGKEARPGRKLGHVNVLRETPATRDAALAEVTRTLGSSAAGIVSYDTPNAYAKRRDALLAEIVDALKREPRFVAAWLEGSLGYGNGHALSDLDVHIAVAPGPDGATDSLLDKPAQIWGRSTPERAALFARFGPVVLLHENHHNAPPDGAYTYCLYADGQHIDWVLCDARNSMRPANSRLLFERTAIPIAPALPTESLEQRRANLEEQWAFFWLMTATCATYIASGHAERAVTQMLSCASVLDELRRLLAGAPPRWSQPALELHDLSQAALTQQLRDLGGAAIDLQAEIESITGTALQPAPIKAIDVILEIQAPAGTA